MAFNMQKLNIEKISVIGLGRLGASLIACLAQKGFEMMGLDSDYHKVNLLKKGLAPVLEPGLDQMIADNRNFIEATKNYHNLISSNQMTFITIPTILGSNNVFSDDAIKSVIKKIAQEIKIKDDYHIVAVMSTLEPGSMDKIILPLLEHESWKVNGSGFGLCYCPVFSESGNTINSIQNLESIVVGDSLGIVTKIVTDVFNRLCNKNPQIQQMNYINAELLKIVKDNWNISKIAFTNFVSELCENTPKADVDVIIQNMKHDIHYNEKMYRIFSHGSPFLKQSSRILKNYLNKSNISSNLIDAAERVQRHQIIRLMNLILATLPAGGQVGILGLSYSAGTDNIQNSPSITLIKWLLKQDITVNAFDPMAIPNTREIFQNKISYLGSITECVSCSSVVVITTPWAEFKHISIDELQQRDDKLVIIDCWNILEKEKYQPFVDYILPGSKNSYNDIKQIKNNYDYNLVDLLEVSKILEN